MEIEQIRGNQLKEFAQRYQEERELRDAKEGAHQMRLFLKLREITGRHERGLVRDCFDRLIMLK
jgi:hypothetical protein